MTPVRLTPGQRTVIEAVIPCRRYEGDVWPGELVSVRAYVLPRWRGLMVHRTPCDADDGSRTYSHLWFTVSHVQSGLAVQKFIEGLGNAVMVANALMEIGDWTRTPAEIVADRDFCEHVKLKLFAFQCCGIGVRGAP